MLKLDALRRYTAGKGANVASPDYMRGQLDTAEEVIAAMRLLEKKGILFAVLQEAIQVQNKLLDQDDLLDIIFDAAATFEGYEDDNPDWHDAEEVPYLFVDYPE
jgi:DNA invertase Pin-like site-specific DNA recombinase